MGKFKKIPYRLLEKYLQDAEIIKWLRNNPIIACEQLLGIKLTDSQKYILLNMWVKPYVCLNCSRNFGKSFMIAVYIMLKAMLFPDLRIYIVSNSGSQAKETFTKIEDLANGNIDSISGILDIFINEIVKNGNSTGFSHDPESFKITLFNGSRIFTLNSVSDNVRGKRADILCIDEAAFCSDEFITAVLPFITQSSDFKTGVDDKFDVKKLRKSMPKQVVYASSAGEEDSEHGKAYKNYAIRMLAGDDKYFVADMPCDIPLQPYIDGKPTVPYLTQSTIDNAMKENPLKAMREYYNKFMTDGGVDQMVRWASVRKNEEFLKPILKHDDKYEEFVIAFDPAHSYDNSIIGVMGIRKNENGDDYIGDVVHMINLMDLAKEKGMQMLSTHQTSMLRRTILNFNGDNSPDYKNIGAVMIDSGAGGGGVSTYADHLLSDWRDDIGMLHKGFIDPTFDRYKEEVKNFPNAWTGVRMISPHKYRMEMCDNLIMNMRENVIKFPKEYNGKGYVLEEVMDKKGEEQELKKIDLTLEEKLSLTNIDALKSELTTIEAHRKDGRVVKYALPKNKENKMHDDRFYVLLMLSHYLYEKRSELKKKKARTKKKRKISNYMFHN